jgi:HTH-type transcriptional regulator, sugar sensing transcriptional regulator
MKETIIELQELGFSEYEAKIYLSLLRDSPATAYEAGKSSGVPTSKVYEVLKKLVEKGILSVIDEGKTKRYVPIEPGEFLDRYKTRTERVVDNLRNRLAAVKGQKELSFIWNIHEYEYLVDKAKRMIDSAGVSVLISIWKEELAILDDRIREALQRKVAVAVVHFGFPVTQLGQMYRHPIEDTIYQEKGGRGFVLIVDSKEVLMGTVLKDNKVEGAWSMNRGFVTMAEDYIKHDVYMMKIVRRFSGLLRKRFGSAYEKLRDIFKDEVIP